MLVPASVLRDPTEKAKNNSTGNDTGSSTGLKVTWAWLEIHAPNVGESFPKKPQTLESQAQNPRVGCLSSWLGVSLGAGEARVGPGQSQGY